MIGFLSGQVSDFFDQDILVTVNGVGYRVTVSNKDKILSSDSVDIFIHTHVKEDQLSLFGFLSKKELRLFVLLISVSGVGPKMALNILTTGTAEEIQSAVAQADVAFFTKAKGIGKKNGQRIIVDLKSKLGNISELDLSEPEAGTDDVFDALIAMGFESQQVQKALKQIDSSLPEQNRIKQAIKFLSK